MANRVTQAPLIIRDENFAQPRTVDSKVKSSKMAFKKGGAGGIGGRKALKDITNKSSVKSEISSRKNVKVPPKEEFNIADEGFLHDHSKCIEEREAALNYFDLNLILPGHDEELKLKEAKVKVDFDNFRCYPEPVELPVTSLMDFLQESAPLTSTPGSPLNREAAMIDDDDDDFFWEFAEVKLRMKQETREVCDFHNLPPCS